MPNHTNLKMIALFAILLQFAFAKNDLILETTDGAFTRIEDGECVYNLASKNSQKATFSSTKAKVETYSSDDCSGSSTSKDVDFGALGYKYIECPKYVGFTGADGTSDCKYQKYSARTYYKEGCHASLLSGSVKYVVENNKLVRKSYDTKDCSGTTKNSILDQAFGGECNTCQVDSVTKIGILVQCGAISQMILAVLAVLFFLF